MFLVTHTILPTVYYNNGNLSWLNPSSSIDCSTLFMFRIYPLMWKWYVFNEEIASGSLMPLVSKPEVELKFQFYFHFNTKYIPSDTNKEHVISRVETLGCSTKERIPHRAWFLRVVGHLLYDSSKIMTPRKCNQSIFKVASGFSSTFTLTRSKYLLGVEQHVFSRKYILAMVSGQNA